jgi:CelD/BcsL family acetyltransferase involved in cellulose biosynthesis
MGWEIHPAKASFPEFADEWDRLNARLYEGHPYFDSRFVGPLLDYFANGKEQLCIHRTDGFVSGALILRPDGLGRWSSFRPSQTQATALLLDDVRLLTTLPSALPGIAWTIVLEAVDPRYSPDFWPLTLPWIAHVQAHTIGIRLEGEFTDYWAKRPKKLVANIDRYTRRTEAELGPPVLSTTRSIADMDTSVGRFGALESAGWKGAAGTAVASDNQQGAFYREVLRRFASTDQAAVYELHVAEKLASSRLVISNDHMVVFLKTTYDESLARFALGRILLHRVIQEQFTRHPGRAIEFYTNATRDQAEWATFGCPIQTIQLFKNEAFTAAFSVLKVFQRNLRSVEHRTLPANDALPSIEIKTATSIEDFTNNQYDLSGFAPKDNIEVAIDWFELLQKQVYPNDTGVRYYFVAEEKSPSMIMPVRLVTKGRIKTVESLGNYYTSLYTPLLTNDSNLSDMKLMLAAATRDHSGAHVMRFAPMDPESPAYKGILNELRAIGWIPFQFFSFGNWFLKVNFDWEGYLKKRSANLRSTIKRMSKKFAAEGGTLEIVTNPEGIEQAIAAFQEVYSESWKIPEPYPDFVPSLIRRLANLGMLRLGIARIQERPIAAQLWIVGENKACIYKVAYNEAFAAYSPGTVLTSHLLQHVIEQDHVKEVDFLIGDDKYKRIWMSDRRERWGIIAYNPRTIIGFTLFLQEAVRRIAKAAGRKFKEKLLSLKRSDDVLANSPTIIQQSTSVKGTDKVKKQPSKRSGMGDLTKDGTQGT